MSKLVRLNLLVLIHFSFLFSLWIRSKVRKSGKFELITLVALRARMKVEFNF